MRGRFLTADAATRVKQLRQKNCQTKARMETKPCEVRGEARLWAGDAKIRHAGDAETAAYCSAMHRRHDWLLSA
jgi:hypothetical protein